MKGPGRILGRIIFNGSEDVTNNGSELTTLGQVLKDSMNVSFPQKNFLGVMNISFSRNNFTRPAIIDSVRFDNSSLMENLNSSLPRNNFARVVIDSARYDNDSFTKFMTPSLHNIPLNNCSEISIESGGRGGGARGGGTLQSDDENNDLQTVMVLALLPMSLSLLSAVLSVLTIRHQRLIHSTKVFLVSFIITEWGKCAAFMTNLVMKVLLGKMLITWSSTYAQYYMTITSWLPGALTLIGFFLNILLSGQRFFLVLYPHSQKAKTCALFRYPKLFITIVSLFFVCFQITTPVVFYIGIYDTQQLNFSETFHATKIVGVITRSSPGLFSIYKTISGISNVLFRHIPIVLALFFNSGTIALLAHHRRRGRQHQKCVSPFNPEARDRQKRKQQATVTIVTSSVIFTVCKALRPGLNIASLITPEFANGMKEERLYLILREISGFLDVMTPLLNFIVYLRVSSEFRTILGQIISRKTSSGEGAALPNNYVKGVVKPQTSK